MHVCDCATCSSEESAKAKTQKEVIKTLKELKLHLPADKRHNNKSSTLNTLKYALRCVKQVEGVYCLKASPFLSFATPKKCFTTFLLEHLNKCLHPIPIAYTRMSSVQFTKAKVEPQNKFRHNFEQVGTFAGIL